jgi:hypothetical protein
MKREPGEPENSREHVVPARIKTLGAERGTAFREGISRWSAGVRPMRFCGKAQERKVRLETTSRSLERNKALKSEAYERWELKEVPKGRKAKKTLRNG